MYRATESFLLTTFSPPSQNNLRENVVLFIIKYLIMSGKSLVRNSNLFVAKNRMIYCDMRSHLGETTVIHNIFCLLKVVPKISYNCIFNFQIKLRVFAIADKFLFISAAKKEDTCFARNSLYLLYVQICSLKNNK